MRKASGTHRSMGTKSGATSGLESGLSEVQKYKAGQGVEINSKSERPKAKKHGSIAMK